MEYVRSLEFVEVPDSVDATDSVEGLESEMALDSVEVMPDSVDAADSIEGLESEMALDSVEVPDSVKVRPDSVEVPEFVEVVPDSVDALDTVNAADSVKVVQCPRCGTFHAGGIFGEACFQARRHARRCARCGLLHEDYDLTARFLHDMEKFECEFYISDVEKLQMDGNTILLPEHVIKKLDQIYSMKKLEDAKMKQEQ
uniref:Uncharacterized protein n=1 Tax=Leersia perrieri TaxID=77586 RepID=A0A0D9XDS5_9ORYZ